MERSAPRVSDRRIISATIGQRRAQATFRGPSATDAVRRSGVAAAFHSTLNVETIGKSR